MIPHPPDVPAPVQEPESGSLALFGLMAAALSGAVVGALAVQFAHWVAG